MYKRQVTHTLAANTVSKQLTVVEYNPEAPEFSDDSNEYEAEAGEPFDIQIDARSALTTTYALVQAPAGMTIDPETCLLYTSDAADDPLCVDLVGR